jgi:hypothetical protein
VKFRSLVAASQKGSRFGGKFQSPEELLVGTRRELTSIDDAEPIPTPPGRSLYAPAGRAGRGLTTSESPYRVGQDTMTLVLIRRPSPYSAGQAAL